MPARDATLSGSPVPLQLQARDDHRQSPWDSRLIPPRSRATRRAGPSSRGSPKTSPTARHPRVRRRLPRARHPGGRGGPRLPWETDYNTFVPEPRALPRVRPAGRRPARARHPRGAVDDADGERAASTSRRAATLRGRVAELRQWRQRNGFFVNDGAPDRGGRAPGAALDFFNPEAVKWWHRQQDPLLLDLGIAGWKLDFGEEYITRAADQHRRGPDAATRPTPRQYYRDFYAHGLSAAGATSSSPWCGRTTSRTASRGASSPGPSTRRWAGSATTGVTGSGWSTRSITSSARRARGYVVIGSRRRRLPRPRRRELLDPGALRHPVLRALDRARRDDARSCSCTGAPTWRRGL